MEFLLLAVLGLIALGTTAATSEDGAESSSDDRSSGVTGNGKDTKEEKPKTPEQKLMEAIAEYEANPPKDKRIKISFEMMDRE